MRTTKWIGWLSLLVSLGGCQGMAGQASRDAVIVEHNEESLNELKLIIESALPGFGVTLSDTALTKSPRLIIERKRHKTLERGVVMGRSEEIPEVFILQLTSDGCQLTQQSTQSHWLLKSARCIEFMP